MEEAQTIPTSGTPRSRRRLVPIVDARFQWKYTLIVMALGVVLTTVMGVLLYRTHAENTRMLDLGGNAQLQARVMQEDQIFLLYLIVFVVLMALGLGFWGLIVTHRISGPLYIVARYLSVLASGHYPDLRPLRKRDELHDFFAMFEEAVNGMRNRDVAVLREVEEAMAEAKKGDAKAGLDAALTALKRVRDGLTDSVGKDMHVPD